MWTNNYFIKCIAVIGDKLGISGKIYLENNINETPLIDQKIIDNLINERARIVPVLINEYRDEIIKMEGIYFSKKLENILLLVNKNLSFDQNL